MVGCGTNFTFNHNAMWRWQITDKMVGALGVFFQKLLREILLNFILVTEMKRVNEVCFLLRFRFMQLYSEALRLRKQCSAKPWYQNARCHTLQDSNYHNLHNAVRFNVLIK